MPITPDIPKVEVAIVELTNVFRASVKQQSVKIDAALTRAARDYARFLAASTVFSHEADGRRPIDRIKAAGYLPCSTAENLAWMSDSRGFETQDLAVKMVEGWKGSPPHRKNMELPLVTQTGVAVVKARSEEKYVAVQLFGRPASLQYKFEIVNNAGRPVAYSIAGQEMQIEPNILVRHTACEPGEVAFQVKRGGLLAKAVTARYPAQDGQVFRLTGNGNGQINVEVGGR